MKIKLLLDEDTQFALALALRKRGYDALHVQEIDRKGLTDVEQLQYAIDNERCLFTYNVKDFVLLHNDFVKNENEHYGIVVSRQLPIGESLKKLLSILLIRSKDSIKNQIMFL